jgi:hypothetical protein
MYECVGYGVNECSAIVNESGLWHLEDGTVVVLCKSCETEVRDDKVKLKK